VNADETTSDVRVWSIESYRGSRRITYTVRWVVAGDRHQQTFATRKLAESFHARLIRAARDGSDFRLADGLPATLPTSASKVTWYAHACVFVDMKWPSASPRHRKSVAEALVAVTCALVRSDARPRDEAALRAALMHWSFNTAARTSHGNPTLPDRYAEAVEWIGRHSVRLADLSQPAAARKALIALSTKLDGSPASPATVARKRSALYSALGYAVELKLLRTNPLDALRWTPPAHTDQVDRRVVVNPDQATALLAAVRHIYPSLEAFYACMYYAALRPAEVRHLRLQDCALPENGWGTLLLTGSTPETGKAWTDTGVDNQDRQLKHRAVRATRPVPASSELVRILQQHIHQYPPGQDGRLFVTRTGRAGVPLAGPYGTPVDMGVVYRVWKAARTQALNPDQVASPLARRPYDLRHAAVSLWLNAGVPATQVAEWAGHSVNVLLRVYAQCVYGQENAALDRIQRALNPQSARADTREEAKSSGRIPGEQP